MPKNVEQFLIRRKAHSETTTPDDPANKTLDRGFEEMFNIAVHLEDIALVPLHKLRPYSKHPFKVCSEEKLSALAESIACDGLQQPVIVRRLGRIPGWEILSGHNRVRAAMLLGWKDIPVIIRDLDDKQAALVVVATNLEQREKLLPSEKAFAYKLRMEALQEGENAIIKRGRKPSDTNDSANSVQFEPGCLSRSVAADSHGVSDSEIQRYIRLTFLLPELLGLLDCDRIPVMAGYEISFLSHENQQEVYHYFFQTETKDKLSLKKAQALRAAAEAGKLLTAETIYGILHTPKKKRGPITYRFSLRELGRQYNLPKDFDLTAFVYEKLGERFAKTGS